MLLLGYDSPNALSTRRRTQGPEITTLDRYSLATNDTEARRSLQTSAGYCDLDGHEPFFSGAERCLYALDLVSSMIPRRTNGNAEPSFSPASEVKTNRKLQPCLGCAQSRECQGVSREGGLPADRIATVSYGKARPFVLGHDESTWKWNRGGMSVLCSPGRSDADLASGRPYRYEREDLAKAAPGGQDLSSPHNSHHGSDALAVPSSAREVRGFLHAVS